MAAAMIVIIVFAVVAGVLVCVAGGGFGPRAR